MFWDIFKPFKIVLHRCSTLILYPFQPDMVNENSKLKKWICDFEMALMNALATEFPGVDIQGCYFHFTVIFH